MQISLLRISLLRFFKTKDWELKKETTFAFGYFSTTSGHFFTIYICIFHKIVVVMVILSTEGSCLMQLLGP